MVCSRGESLTTHMNQMKLFNAITAAVVVGTSFIAATPAEARNGWIYIGENTEGVRMWIKPASSGGYKGYFYNSTRKSGPPSYYQVNCNNWSERYRYSDGSGYLGWQEVMPNSMGDKILRYVCS